MSDLTRRGFVRSSAGAAAGLTAIGALGVGEADATTTKHHPPHKAKKHSDSNSVVAWIGDPHNGRITIMAGKHEVTIHDHNLAAEIARHVN